MKNKNRSKAIQLKNNRLTINDKLVYLAIFSPIMTVPQLSLIWAGRTQGVSKITWIAYLCVATVMLLYGIKYRLKPLIFVQSCWVFIDFALVAGLLLHHQ